MKMKMPLRSTVVADEFKFNNTYNISPCMNSPKGFGKYSFVDDHHYFSSSISITPNSSSFPKILGNCEAKDYNDDDPTEFAFQFNGGKIEKLKLKPTKLSFTSPPQKYEESDPLLPKVKGQKERKPSSSSRLKSQNMVSEPKPDNFEKKLNKRASLSTSSSSRSNSNRHGKWNFMDILLFRKPYESHATSKECGVFGKSDKIFNNDDVKSFSFRKEDNGRSDVAAERGGGRRRKEQVSAHERHYRKNRMAAEEMRRKTFLPYKKTILGCTDLDPGVYEFSKDLPVGINC